MKNFKHTTNLREFYTEYLYTHHLDTILNILL